MERGTIIHVLVLPLPLQGHINPMLQFSKRLASKGLQITFITASSMDDSMQQLQQHQASNIRIEPIFDGFLPGQKPSNVDKYCECYKATVPKSLADLITKYKATDHHPIKYCLVYDSCLSWALDVAHEFGFPGAPFFTQTCAVSALYYHLANGSLKFSNSKGGTFVSPLPCLPELEIQDLPSLVHGPGPYPSVYDFLTSQFLNVDKADWLIWNTFTELEDEVRILPCNILPAALKSNDSVNILLVSSVSEMMASKWPIKPIGPTIPSMFLDKRLEDDKDYGLHLFTPNSDACIKWLDSKKPGSVVYVSFGSLATLSQDQVTELAWGMRRSSTSFLWILRDGEEKKLPTEFLMETVGNGLVVKWCPQLQVLAHKSVGCFVTHCGWNSTLEALSLGVPMVAMPQWSDQPTNGKWVCDVWRVGVRVKVEGNGIVTREEIERCVREVMTEGKKKDEMRKNAEKFKEEARKAVEEGGSSDRNIDDFISELIMWNSTQPDDDDDDV